MTGTQTHQTLIGDDGELTAPAPEQTGDESVYAALPQLFLIDPNHAAYIAGKKTKPGIHKPHRSWSVSRRDVKQFVLIFVCAFVAVLCATPTKEFSPDIVGAIAAAFGITVVPALTFGCFSGIIKLITLPSNLRDKHTKRRLYTHGILLKGEVTYFKTIYKKRANPLWTRVTDEIHYRFTTPGGRELNIMLFIPRYGNLAPIQIGTPVAVLYVDDHSYMLL